MITETLTWHEVTERLPDTDRNVFVEPVNKELAVWPGFLDAEGWCFSDGDEIEGGVARWAEMPRGGRA